MSRHLCLALLGAFLASGCSGVARVVPATPQGYSPLDVSYATSGGTFPTVVHGNPFGGDKATLDSAVTDALQANYAGPPTTFAVAAPTAGRPLYRVLVWFNPAAAIPNLGLCVASELPSQQPSGHIEVQAALCRGGGMVAGATGYVDGVGSVDDAGFRSLMAGISNELFRTGYSDHTGCAAASNISGNC